MCAAHGHHAMGHDIADGNAVSEEVSVVKEGFPVIADEQNEGIVEHVSVFESAQESSCRHVEVVDLICVGMPESGACFGRNFGSVDGAIVEDIVVVLLIGKMWILIEHVHKKRSGRVVFGEELFDVVHEMFGGHGAIPTCTGGDAARVDDGVSGSVPA